MRTAILSLGLLNVQKCMRLSEKCRGLFVETFVLLCCLLRMAAKALLHQDSVPLEIPIVEGVR